MVSIGWAGPFRWIPRKLWWLTNIPLNSTSQAQLIIMRYYQHWKHLLWHFKLTYQHLNELVLYRVTSIGWLADYKRNISDLKARVSLQHVSHQELKQSRFVRIWCRLLFFDARCVYARIYGRQLHAFHIVVSWRRTAETIQVAQRSFRECFRRLPRWQGFFSRYWLIAAERRLPTDWTEIITERQRTV